MARDCSGGFRLAETYFALRSKQIQLSTLVQSDTLARGVKTTPTIAARSSDAVRQDAAAGHTYAPKAGDSG